MAEPMEGGGIKLLIVEIHWVDSMGLNDWVEPDSLNEVSNTIETIGYLINETEDAYIVSSSRVKETEEVNAPIKIPKVSIFGI